MLKRKEYTREIHIERLSKLLDSNKALCNCCPSAKYYSGSNSSVKLWFNNPCNICCEFVGYKPRHTIDCPCMKLGDTEALNITLKKMEEEGIAINQSQTCREAETENHES